MAKKSKKSKKPSKLYAIVDDGGLNGDSAYYCPSSHVEYKKGMTLDDVRKAYRTKLETEEDGNPFLAPEEIDEQVNEIKVAWVVDEKIYTALVNGWPDVGNDSATYCANHGMKLMAKELAVKTLGESL